MRKFYIKEMSRADERFASFDALNWDPLWDQSLEEWLSLNESRADHVEKRIIPGGIVVYDNRGIETGDVLLIKMVNNSCLDFDGDMMILPRNSVIPVSAIPFSNVILRSISISSHPRAPLCEYWLYTFPASYVEEISIIFAYGILSGSGGKIERRFN